MTAVTAVNDGVYDVVVVGGGAAGLACAIAAADRGLRVVVLERHHQLGVGTSVSAGLIWIGASDLAAKAGAMDCEEEVRKYLRYVGASGIDEERMNAFIHEGPTALKYFQAAGLKLQLTSYADQYLGVAPGSLASGRVLEPQPIARSEIGSTIEIARPVSDLYRLGGARMLARDQAEGSYVQELCRLSSDAVDTRAAGPGLISWLLKLAATRDIEICCGDRVQRLIMRSDRAVGVETDASARVYARRGVVIACGGYESNEDLAWQFEAFPGWRSMFPSAIRGDGMIMAQEIGAAVRTIPNSLSIFLGASIGHESEPCHLAGIKELLCPHTVVVNQDGCRFANETFFQGMVPGLREFDVRRRRSSNLPCFLIFDQQFANRYSFGPGLPGDPVPSTVFRDPSIVGLSSKLGIDPTGLEKTIQQFNASVRSGRDLMFRRDDLRLGVGYAQSSRSLGTIEEPPFYGIELHPTGLSSAGLHCDERSRVRHVRGHTIQGLFAIGNAAARTETGSGYQAGFSHGTALTFAFIVAGELASMNSAL